MTDSLKKLVNNACAGCGNKNLTLAKDHTQYSPSEFNTTTCKWEATYNSTEELDGEDSIRFFCPNCGEYHEVPEELT